VVEAVRRHPFMLSGTGQLDTLLVEATGGRVLAKVGAEATYGAVDLSSGTGLALKVLDGAPRARGAALLAALRALDWLTGPEWDAVIDAATVPIHGGGHPVGTVHPAKLTLTTPD
jgi:L-asparaginase II